MFEEGLFENSWKKKKNEERRIASVRRLLALKGPTCY